ncbi:MAG: hypothetical protein PHN80_10740 [Hespellia sp.]|nr:hypothetical protein [Hespellia sp.]
MTQEYEKVELPPKVMQVSELLSFREIRILLQSLGYDQVTGICLQSELLTEEEIVVEFQKMVKKGILTEQGGHFILEKRIGRMMACMGNPEATFVLFEERNDLPTCYCYRKCGEILISELYQIKRNTLKLLLLEESEYEQWKEEREL